MTRLKKIFNNNLLFSSFIFAMFLILYIFYGIIIWFSNLSLFGWTLIITFAGSVTLLIRKIKQIRIQKKNEKRLRELQRQGNLNDLRKMHPIDFEFYICDLFKQNGFDATVTSPTGDGGKDILVYKNKFFAIVECKRYSSKNKVTRPEIQKFHSAIIDCKADKGYFITTGEFTKHAVSYVFDKPIELINGEKLIDMIEETGKGNYIT